MKRHASDIDTLRRAVTQSRRGIAIAVRHLQTAPEISSGTGREYPELNVLTRVQDPVYDLVYRPVAAAGDDECPPAACCSLCDHRSVARCFGKGHSERSKVSSQVCGDTGPLFARSTRRRLGVDDHERQ